MTQALVFGGSLLAVLGIAGLVHLFALGTGSLIRDEDHAREIAGEASAGFTPKSVLLDDDGRAALLHDDEGNALVLRQHGPHFVGRLVAADKVSRTSDRVIIDTGERRFGMVTLRCSRRTCAGSDA